MKTLSVKATDVKREWLIVDADGKTLGRLASQVALRLRGKHKPTYTPNADTGDYVVIINAAKIAVTGNKAQDKKYFRHSEFPGGMRETNFEKLIQKHPEEVLEIAIRGMLPKNPLGREMFRKLKVYPGVEHPHAAQQPRVIEIGKGE